MGVTRKRLGRGRSGELLRTGIYHVFVSMNRYNPLFLYQLVTIWDSLLTSHRDAWNQQTGLSRTEAKRRYITTLIDAMRKYASPSPDARELVSELEFVWDQVKSNVPSSSSSSPEPSPAARSGLHGGTGLRVVRHVAVDGADDDGGRVGRYEEANDSGDEFVDAQDSQYDVSLGNEGRQPQQHPNASALSKPRNTRHPNRSAATTNSPDHSWRRRVEQALERMTTEVAALREQLETRRLVPRSTRKRLLAWLAAFLWAAAKHFVVDVVLFVLVLLWLRRKKDRRLEGAVRVLLGDAVAQVKKVKEAQMASIGRMHLPRLPSVALASSKKA